MACTKTTKVFLICIVIALMLSQEVEARRKILKGRKALTRTYLRDSPIPAWAIVLLVGLGEIIVGAVVFVVMKKVVIDSPLVGSYAPAQTAEA